MKSILKQPSQKYEISDSEMDPQNDMENLNENMQKHIEKQKDLQIKEEVKKEYNDIMDSYFGSILEEASEEQTADEHVPIKKKDRKKYKRNDKVKFDENNIEELKTIKIIEGE